MLINFSRIPEYFNLGRNGSSKACGISVEAFGADEIRLQPVNSTGWLTRCIMYVPREAALQVANAILDAAGLERVQAKTAAQDFETRRVVILSTEHVPSVTWDRLGFLAPQEWPVSGGFTAFGAYIYAHDRDAEIESFPGLAQPLLWARQHGFDYVQFDRDADPRADLPTYDEEGQAI